MIRSTTAAAHPNLALVKYWGQRDPVLNLPANDSISVNLSGARTVTRVDFDGSLADDIVVVNGRDAEPDVRRRVVSHLDRIRAMGGVTFRARVTSRNDFPMDVGFASSSSAFAALSLAGARALGLGLSERALSILARKGSGSACRSIPDGFVEWAAGSTDSNSYARSLAPEDHWDLSVVTVTFGTGHKSVSSLQGHRAASSSPFYAARLAQLPQRLQTVRSALRHRDLEALGMAAECEAISLHCVAMTSQVQTRPEMSGIYYWQPETLRLMLAVQRWRQEGLDVYFTLDAGSSVHLLIEQADLARLQDRLERVISPTGGRVFVSKPGRGAWVVEDEDAFAGM